MQDEHSRQTRTNRLSAWLSNIYRLPLHTQRLRHRLTRLLLAIRQARRISRGLDDAADSYLEEAAEAGGAGGSGDVGGGAAEVAAGEGYGVVFGVDVPVVLVGALGGDEFVGQA